MRAAWCLLLLVAGCASDAPPASVELPQAWDQGSYLHPYQMYGDHGGGRGATLHPTEPLFRPASCTAYRDNVSHAGDGCQVRDPRYTWEQDVAWVIEAKWAGCPDRDINGCPTGYPEPYEPRVVAFSGHPAAWWDGRPAEDTVFVTE